MKPIIIPILFCGFCIFCAMVFFHPDLHTYKQHVIYKCCENEKCSLEGNCLDKIKYLTERCENKLNKLSKLSKSDLFDIINKNC